MASVVATRQGMGFQPPIFEVIHAERQRLQRALTEQATERDRMMTLFRRGRATLAEVETHLDAIDHEAEALRTKLGALRAQQELADAFAAQYADATMLLTRLQERLEEVEQTNDVQTKRQVIELLVARIGVETTEVIPRRKQANLTITYTFVPRRVVKFNTLGRFEGLSDLDIIGNKKCYERWRTDSLRCLPPAGGGRRGEAQAGEQTRGTPSALCPLPTSPRWGEVQDDGHVAGGLLCEQVH